MKKNVKKAAWEKEAIEIVEAERSYTDQIRKIRDETRRELYSPPDPPSETTDKISDAATFVTDLLQNMMKDFYTFIWKNKKNILEQFSHMHFNNLNYQ